MNRGESILTCANSMTVRMTNGVTDTVAQKHNIIITATITASILRQQMAGQQQYIRKKRTERE